MSKFGIKEATIQLFSYEVVKKNIPDDIKVVEKEFEDFVKEHSLVRSKEAFAMMAVFDDEFGNHCAEYGGAKGISYWINPDLLAMGKETKSKIKDIRKEHPLGKEMKCKPCAFA